MAENNFVDDMIPYVEFADNANERTPCVLVLDCSGSMRGEPIKQLNVGLKALEKELKEDIDASSRVQLLIIKAFGKDETEVSADWIDAMNFTAPEMALMIVLLPAPLEPMIAVMEPSAMSISTPQTASCTP